MKDNNKNESKKETQTGALGFFGKNIKFKEHGEVRVKDQKRGAIRDVFPEPNPHSSVQRHIELLGLISDLQESGPHELPAEAPGPQKG